MEGKKRVDSYNTHNINPKLEDWLDYNTLKESYEFLQENEWKLSKEFLKLTKKYKRVVFSILQFFNKYDIDINEENSYQQLFEKVKKWTDMYDYWIISNIEEKVSLKWIAKEDKENLQDMSDEIWFFWSVEQWWTPISIDGNLKWILWYEKDDFINWKINYADIIHPDDLVHVQRQVKFYTDTKQETFLQSYRLRKKDWTYIKVRDKTKCKYDEKWYVKYFYGYVKDITEEIKTHEQLIHLNKELYKSTYINPKTWLQNKNKLIRDLEATKHPLLFLFKIKNFGAINSLYWFSEWNKILKLIVKKLKKSLKRVWLHLELYNNNNATHFWVLWNLKQNVNAKEIIQEIENILDNFNIETKYWKMHFKFVGWVACCEEDTYDKALSSLYLSKIKKVDYTYYNENLMQEQEERTRHNLYWINQILDAIKNKDFYPVYQWIRNNETGKIEKYEALIRLNINWKEISPWVFLKYIEELNKNVDVTNIMLEKIFSEMKYHDKEVSINITKEDFTDSWFSARLISLLEKYNVNPNRIILEILESISISDFDFINEIEWLKKLGIKFSIDDFWNWYSNFSRLMYLNPDYIKVDWSLIKDIHNDEKKQKILRLIKRLAEINDSKIIAEFVENEKIQNVLDILWIEYSQWYLFSKPSKLEIPKKED